MKLTEEEIGAICRREIDESLGYDADVLASERSEALDYYNGIKPTPPGNDLSAIVSHDVADTVNSLMAQVMPMFTTSIIQFEPRSEEDEAQAQLESDFVKKEIERADGFANLYDAVWNALLSGNGWMKVEMKTDTIVNRETYGELSDMDIAMIQQQQDPGLSVEINPLANGNFEVVTTRTTEKMQVNSISPDVMLFSHSYDQFNVQELRFVGERVLYTVSDLIAMGMDREDAMALPDGSNDYWPAITAREGQYRHEADYDTRDIQDAENLKECFDCYLRLDIEGNGESELYNILIGGESTIITMEPASHIPYATGSPVPMPHRVQGIGMYQLMKQIQDAKTASLRSFLDQLRQNITGRYGVLEGQVNLDDAMDNRVSGLVRMSVRDGMFPLTTPNSTDEAIRGLNYLDTVREQRGGASLDMNDADRQLMQSSATAASGVMANHEEMAGWYASNLVNTILKQLFMLAHRTLRLASTQPVGAKLRGKWVQTMPSEWQPRDCLEVTAGMTTQQRQQRIQGLSVVYDQLMGLATQGFEGIITDRGKIYAAMCDWIRAADLGDPSDYLVDPESEEAQQVAQQKQQAQDEQAAKMEEIQMALMDLERRNKEQERELERYKHDTELRWKYYDTDRDNAAKVEVAEGQITGDIIKEGMKPNGQGQAATDA